MSLSLPEHVSVREVGPRDGFQNEPEVIPTPQKIRLIDLLMATGLRRMEVTSFVRPDAIGQLADATEVLQGIERVDGVSTERPGPERARFGRCVARQGSLRCGQRVPLRQ